VSLQWGAGRAQDVEDAGGVRVLELAAELDGAVVLFSKNDYVVRRPFLDEHADAGHEPNDKRSCAAEGGIGTVRVPAGQGS